MSSLARCGPGDCPTIALLVLAAACVAGCASGGAGRPVAGTVSGVPVDRPESLAANEQARKHNRQVLSPAYIEARAKETLRTRDVPLAAGAQAPRFDGYPEGSLAVIVFFRGEW